MSKFKCKYCSNEPSTVYNDEPLCRKHYKQFYSEKLSDIQLEKVDKIAEEIRLNKSYTKILDKFDFYNTSTSNQNKLKKIIKDFERDISSVKLRNPLYFNVDK